MSHALDPKPLEGRIGSNRTNPSGVDLEGFFGAFGIMVDEPPHRMKRGEVQVSERERVDAVLAEVFNMLRMNEFL